MTIHQHLYSTLHLHLALPAARAARLASATARGPFAAAPLNAAGKPATSSSPQLTLYRELMLSSQLRWHSSSVSIRHERVAVAVAVGLIVAAPSQRRVFVTSSTREPVMVPRPTLAAPSARHTSTLFARQTPAPPSRAHLQSPGAAKTLAPPSVSTATLAWQKPARGADSPSDAAVDGASAQTVPVSAPATVRGVYAHAALAPQQLREALRVNLLDGVFTERLTDDVMRRVEKRLRIERERQGL